ncbi:MAG: WGR domain-containing protein [Myxococcales bacterium]|nr:WGR domain-containing protein [Myxococcales bacterium]
MPKAYALTDPSAPKFPSKFDILKKAVLQKTDLNKNNNKYYALELHSPSAKTKKVFRVFTHYGRTDDLETNPEAGKRECRYFTSHAAADACYEELLRKKTSRAKGYKELSLAASKIGSMGARGLSVGELDAKTLAANKKAAKKKTAKKAARKPLTPALSTLVDYIYSEATNALTSTVKATITANGIETPLGVLTHGQIDKGQAVLDAILDELKRSRKRKAKLRELSGEFYTLIPHRLGRTRAAIEAATISSKTAFAEKNDTLQLMRDMLQVSGDDNVLFDGGAADQYAALGCAIEPLAKTSAEYKRWSKHVLDNQLSRGIKIVNLYTLKRPPEHKSYRKLSNERLLFHGSSLRNWVGILSRGILLPKVVVGMGVSRTDEGWLGHGIYFGSESCTAVNYTYPGKRGTSMMAICRVALGKIKRYRDITYGLTRPPRGYDSCHGISNVDDDESEFDDNEYVIYDTAQQRLEVLVEFK